MAHSHHHAPWKRLGDGTLLTQDADEGLGHVLPFSVYMRTLVTLLILTIVTVAVAQIDFGSFNAVVALFIATIKAVLVACFFMHLKFESRLVIMFAIYPIILLFLFIGSNVLDVHDRVHIYPSTGADAAGVKLLPHAGSSHGAGHDGPAEGDEIRPHPGARLPS